MGTSAGREDAICGVCKEIGNIGCSNGCECNRETTIILHWMMRFQIISFDSVSGR